MKTARFNRAVRVGAFAVLPGLFGPLLPPGAAAQQADAQGATGLERVMQAIEHLSPELQDEVVEVYHYTAGSAYHSSFRDPACMALEYAEGRPGNPDHRARVARETFFRDERHWLYEACADRDRIVEGQTARADRVLASDQGLTEDQRAKIAACVGEAVADRYLEGLADRSLMDTQRYLSLRGVSLLFSAALRECRREPSR